MNPSTSLIDSSSIEQLREAEAGTVVTPLRLEGSMQHACTMVDSDIDQGCCSMRGLRKSCCAKDPSEVTPRALWLAKWGALVSFAIFCSSVVVLIVTLEARQQQRVSQLAAAEAFIHANLTGESDSINYTAAQARWVALRDSLNLTILSAESSQADALRYLSLMPSLHDVEQQFAIAVIFYEWGGPYWNLQVRDTFKPRDRWMTGPTSSSGSSGSTQDGEASATSTTSDAAAALSEECTWKGIGCDSKGRVTAVNLTDSNAFSFAQGTIPTEIALLTHLTLLSIPEHGLQGSIPTELARLAALKELDVRYNKLESASDWLVRVSAESAPVLEHLRVSYNLLNDEWGTSELNALGSLGNLVELDVKNNPGLTSTTSVVDYAASWPHLKIFSVGQSGLSIEMSDQVGHWGSLQVLDAGGTSLSGTLSPLLAPDIQSLLLVTTGGASGMTGTIPTEIGLWTNLEEIDLTYNPLTTTLPTEIGLATSLRVITLKYNPHLTGTLPTELGNLAKLTSLDVSATSLTGTFPTEIAKCHLLNTLRVETTQLVGSLPEAMCSSDRNWYDLTASCLVPDYSAGSSSTSRVFQCDCCTDCFSS